MRMHSADDVLQSDIALLVGMDDDDDEEIELHSDNSEGGQLHQSEVIDVICIIWEIHESGVIP